MGGFRRVGTPDYVKKLSPEYLLVFKQTSALAQAVQKIDFWRSIWEGFGGVVPRTAVYRSIYLLNIS